MAYKVKKECRVCGKLFVPCSTCENDNTAFHWRSVACSQECGKEYLRRVLEARQPKEEKKIIKDKPIKSKNTKSVFIKGKTKKAEN